MLKQKTRGNSNMTALSKSKEIIDQTSHYGANNYHPLPIVEDLDWAIEKIKHVLRNA